MIRIPDRPRALGKQALNWTVAQVRPERATMADLRACYRILLGRRPDKHGLDTFSPKVRRQGIGLTELVGYFLSSREFKERMLDAVGAGTGGVERVEVTEGFSLYVRAGHSLVGDAIRATRQYEPHVAERLNELLAPGSTFVDVGASIGFYTVLAARRVGSKGRVLAFEPGPQNLTLLYLNIYGNELANVEARQLAISDKSGFLLYNREGDNGQIAPFDGRTERLALSDLVPSATLDEALAAEDRVDVIKIDVEGAEGLVLRGAEKVLRDKRPRIIFEFSPPSLEATSQETGVALLDNLESMGYRFEVISAGPRRGEIVGGAVLLNRFASGGSEHFDVLAIPHS